MSDTPVTDAIESTLIAMAPMPLDAGARHWRVSLPTRSYADTSAVFG